MWSQAALFPPPFFLGGGACWVTIACHHNDLQLLGSFISVHLLALQVQACDTLSEYLATAAASLRTPEACMADARKCCPPPSPDGVRAQHSACLCLQGMSLVLPEESAPLDGKRILPRALWTLKALRALNLSQNAFKSCPAGLSQLSNLQFLDLSGCKDMQVVPMLLDLSGFNGPVGCMWLSHVCSTHVADAPASTAAHAQLPAVPIVSRPHAPSLCT